MTELESRTLCVDIDHTICHHNGDYAQAVPLPGACEALSRLRKAGWVIVLFTARHFNHWKITTDWLKQHDVPFDQLVFGKPPARYYIDDRAIPFEGDWKGMSERLMKIATDSENAH